MIKEKPYLIAIDIGTTSTKVIAFSNESAILSSWQKGYETFHPTPDRSEQDPEEIFKVLTEGIRLVQKECKNVGKAKGIVFSAAMHSLICMDEKGMALTPALLWLDNRSAEIAQKLKNSPEGQWFYSQTGTPIHPMSPFLKLLWIKENQRELFDKSYKFIGIKEYIFFRLFDQYLIDISLASATGLFSLHQMQWNKASLDFLGIKESQLSKPVSIDHREYIAGHWAATLDLPEQTPCIIGASDGCLANLGAGAIGKNTLAVTIGTSGAVRLCIPYKHTDSKMRTFCYLLDEAHWIAGGATNNSAIVMDWLRLCFCAHLSSLDAIQHLEKVAKSIVPGSDGLVFLPYLLGERSPLNRPDAKGVFFGLDSRHGQAHFIRSAMEGVIFALYSIWKALEEEGFETENIYAGGGFANSHFWLQMLADVFGKRVYLSESVEHSATGAALVGWKALGKINDLKERRNQLRFSYRFNPNPEIHLVYQKNFSLFLKLSQQLYG